MRRAALVVALAVAVCPQPAAADALTVLAQLATAEDPHAAAAVTWVVLNRSGCQVQSSGLRCRVPVLRTVTHGHAFGTVLRGRWRAAWHPDGRIDARVLEEVRAVLLGRVADPTGHATHYHREGTWTPPWAPPRGEWRKIGSHYFYKEARR